MGKIILFRHIEKTAGSTFKFILANNFGISYCNSMMVKTNKFDSKYLKLLKIIYPNLRAIGGHNVFLDKTFCTEKYLIITFLREPVSRTISNFQHYSIGENIEIALKRFPEWIKNENNHNVQTKKISKNGCLKEAKEMIKNIYDFVGITEDFDISLIILSRLLNQKLNLNYTKKQVSKNSNLSLELKNSNYYLNQIKEINALDIELYYFVKENIFNNLRKKYIRKEVKNLDVINNKYTINSLISMWYNKLVLRTLFRNYRPK